MTSYNATDIDQLGFLLNRDPYDSQTQVLRSFLSRFSPSSVVKLINHPIKRYSGQTSVHLAAANGLWECLEILLSFGGNPNATSAPPDLCQTPLHLAARKGYELCLQILLENGAKMELRNTRQEKAIHLVRGKVNCERVFNHAIARFQIPKRTREQQQRVDDLHSMLAEEKFDQFYQLYEQLPPDHRDLATRWTDFYQNTLLYRAATNNLEKPVAFLLDRSSNQPLHNLDTYDTPLLVACRNNNLQIVTMLLSHSPNLVFIQDAHSKRSPLHHACSRGKIEMVDAILTALDRVIQHNAGKHQQKYTLDFMDDLNRTPLFNACYYGFTDIVERLIKFQKERKDVLTLNVNSAIKSSQRTPLHVAVKKGAVEIVKILLSTEDIEISPEARPSKDTHKQLVHLIQKQRHGRMLPSDMSFDETNEPSSDPCSPEKQFIPSQNKSSATPTPTSSWSNLQQPLTNSSESPSSGLHTPTDEVKSPPAGSERVHAFTMPKQRPSDRKISTDSTDSGSRPIRSISGAVSPGESSIGVFLGHTGKLEVLPKDTNSGYTIFDKLLVTPLAEACVYGKKDIVRTLLERGAKDAGGLSCRIAHLLQNTELMQLILSFDCSLVEPTKEQKKKYGKRAPHWLHLLWSSKLLPQCSGTWFSDDVIFRPVLISDSGDTGTYGRSRREGTPEIPQLTTVHSNRILDISLDTNSLTEVPIEVFKLPEVHEINLSRNAITKLPEAVLTLNAGLLSGWECTNLVDLNISRNKLQSLPSCVWLLPKLQSLRVANNELASLLPNLSNIDVDSLTQSLSFIDVSNNKLKAIPDFVFKFKQLKQVNISSNSLTSIPETLWLCKSLQELDLSKNKLTVLPWCEPEDSMEDSRDIQVSTRGPSGMFGLADRVIGGVDYVNPISVKDASSLRRQPSVFHNVTPISDPGATSTVSAIETCDYSSLSKLNLAKNKFTFYPEALPCLAPNLTDLDVSDNKFEQIDIQFIPQSMKKFSARRCGIKRFGNVMDKKMHAIVTHSCRHGDTFGHPCQHRAHTRLRCINNLHLTKNKLQHLQLIHHKPHDVSSPDNDHGAEEKVYSVNLTSLDLLYPVLEGLDVSYNDLRGLFNPNIGYQQHLQWIWLNGNDNLEMLPLEFAHLKNTRQFTELQFCDLPRLTDPPQEYRSDTVSLSHLLSYMRSRLKDSEHYRTIKLFFIGSGERGKTTLLRRLQGVDVGKLKKLDCDRTIGIDVIDWRYPTGTSMFKSSGQPVHFLAWDFAGQDVYHTTHQCFYSRRSLYLALFRLCDREKGIDELEQWLRNVKLRAPGCPVIIVGTHLDKVAEGDAVILERKALERFSDTSIYPKVIATMSINSVSRNPLNNHMEKLRCLIYNVACHLQLTKDGGLEYKPDMKDSDPKSLFQQLIPTTFRALQDRLRERVRAAKREGVEAPIMEEAEFKQEFLGMFEDEEELQEAVYCLNLQGTLLHFEDHGLKNIYFLDPQWLAKLMANVIHPSSAEENSPIRDGVADVNALFTKLDVPQAIKDKYINLLEKFEVALTIKGQRIIIPSLLPDSTKFPKADDNLSDVQMSPGMDDCYQPPLRRFWMSGYIPDGFWPRLICRVVNDQQIGKILRTILGDDPDLMDDTDDSQKQEGVNLDWTPWKTGIVYKCRGRTLLLIKQEICSRPVDVPPEIIELYPNLTGEYRIEVHIYTNEWVKLANDLSEQGILNSSLSPDFIPGLATKLLVVLSTHIKSLAINYFSGMLLSHLGRHAVTYMPCWKCFAEVSSPQHPNQEDLINSLFVWKKNTPVTCFGVEDSIVKAIKGEDFECILHGKIKVVHLAPDLIFWDLVTQYEDSCGQLHIMESEVLGKGGFGFVCRGDLTPEHGSKKQVAIKVFLQGDLMQAVEHSTIQELLTLSQDPKNILYAYKEIRQEVSFLASLNSPFLTELCGVKLDPYMCLMLELAPKQSLRVMLKRYKEHRMFLEPLTIKNTVLQISKGLEYLHRHQVVHLDIKSPNVLVWHFPSPQDSRQLRVRQAGNVWIKLADYGISQLSTRQTLRVGNNPAGTPGFMAPELFESPGQEVSAEQVDVFALGMTFYEMLSQKTPFDNIHPHVKRNQEVRNKHRPIPSAKETRSLILFQDLMALCWDHDPENRPTTKQIVDWVDAPEFERLRAQISLNGVKSISCACVCRILPENEEEVLFPQPTNERKLFHGVGGASCPIDPDKRSSRLHDMTSLLDQLDDVFKKYGEADDGGSPQQNILITSAGDEMCIETKGKKIKDEDEDIYQFLPTRETPQDQDEILEGGVVNDVAVQCEFEPYTQIWLCGRGDRKGVLQVFTYNDGHIGHCTFSGYCSSEEVTAICPVRNLMWLGTANGTIKIFHAPTLKVRFAAKMVVHGGKSASFILNIIHVEEASCVLVASHNGEIWVFYDRVIQGGLKVRERITLPEFSPCFHLVKVPHRDPGKVEVWGTMDHNRVLVLERVNKKWMQIELEASPGDLRLKLCSYIVHTSFTSRTTGLECSHTWVSYRNRSLLVGFDALTRKQRCRLNCADALRNRDDPSCQVVTMVAKGVKLFVGTSGGIVGVFDSESVELLNVFSWHKEKVRTLLVMPKEMEACICNEIPFNNLESEHQNGVSKGHKFQRGMSAFAYLENQHCIHNDEPDAVMLMSIGNGRRKYQVSEQSKQERIKIFNDTQHSIGRRPTSMDKLGEDIVLLQWRS